MAGDRGGRLAQQKAVGRRGRSDDQDADDDTALTAIALQERRRRMEESRDQKQA